MEKLTNPSLKEGCEQAEGRQSTLGGHKSRVFNTVCGGAAGSRAPAYVLT